MSLYEKTLKHLKKLNPMKELREYFSAKKHADTDGFSATNETIGAFDSYGTRRFRTTDSVHSFLVSETQYMADQQRILEQAGHRQLASVAARERHETYLSQDNEAQQGMLPHALLDKSQRFDGIDDPALNPHPPSNPAARTKYENERREQEKEKQLRLGNMPKMSNAPKPRGP